MIFDSHSVLVSLLMLLDEMIPLNLFVVFLVLPYLSKLLSRINFVSVLLFESSDCVARMLI